MKVWARIEDGKVMGYDYDFPNGLPGCALVDKDAKAKVETAVPVPVVEDRAELEDAYENKHGKRPHPAMKLDKLKAAVE